ncbi:MAG: sugar phosphate isomerase/epimerase [Bryobacterales bacterium]|nr:sugar phosphate isomerase/epimerase [Bryobacterales bacterium]MBV9401003.1 sugar phosphate isomerase/epimerase [Bryobacterales bacterium]
MQRALSTHLHCNHHLTTVLLDRIWDAGIPLVEIFCARQHLDYRDKAQISELSYWFRDSELKLHSLHSPMFSDDVWGRSGPDSVIDITEPVKSKRIAKVDEIKRALEIAEAIPFRYLIQHLGVSGAEFDERKLDAGFSALEEIMLFAGQRGVEVLIENTPNAMASAERLLYFFEITHLKLNVCLDLGHAHIKEGIEQAYRLLGPRIRSTHVHDNNGKQDLHLFPFLDEGGTIEWGRAMKTLCAAPDQYPLLLELRDAPDVRQPIERARRVFERLENLKIDE